MPGRDGTGRAIGARVASRLNLQTLNPMMTTPSASPVQIGAWLGFRGHELLLTDSLEPPTGDALSALCSLPRRVLQIGEHLGLPCFAAELPPEATAPAGSTFTPLRRLNEQLPHALQRLAARGLELLEWDRTHQFCGACGSPTRPAEGAMVRRCANPDCRREHYPRVSPVVIMAVEDGERILLGRSPHFAPGLYSTLAGFVDAGESAEEAIEREIFEETALKVRRIRYFASQPWPFPHSLMLGFQADYAGGEIRCAPGEIEDAAFFPVDALPAVLPGPSTIAHWLIRDFCQRHGREMPKR